MLIYLLRCTLSMNNRHVACLGFPLWIQVKQMNGNGEVCVSLSFLHRHALYILPGKNTPAESVHVLHCCGTPVPAQGETHFSSHTLPPV